MFRMFIRLAVYFVLLFDAICSRTRFFLFFSRKFVFVHVVVSEFLFFSNRLKNGTHRCHFLSAFHAKGRRKWHKFVLAFRSSCSCLSFSNTHRKSHRNVITLSVASNWWYKSKNRKCEIKWKCQVREHAAPSISSFRWHWRRARNSHVIQFKIKKFHRNKSKRTSSIKWWKECVCLFSSHPFIVAANTLLFHWSKMVCCQWKTCCRKWIDVDDSLK